MPSRKRKAKRREDNSKTLKDFFAVERTIKKGESGNRKEKFRDIGRNGVCMDNSACAQQSSANGNQSVKIILKRDRNARWNTLKDYFPVRRSSRKPESEIKKEKRQEVEETVLSEEERGLRIRCFEEKGRGVVATKPYNRGDFVVEYRGDLIDLTEAKRRECIYEEDPDVGCYMYYFQHKNQPYCVDATAETGYLGRLVNHSAKDPNCVTRILEVKNVPHLILVAARDISVGEELLYDYGDRSRHAVEANPWLRTT